MKKRKPRIIQDKKKRGEWAESVFMARAGEHGLPVSRPWGEMSRRVAHPWQAGPPVN
jgi:hypothetical protein